MTGSARIEVGDPRVAVIGLCFQVMEADGAVRSSERRVISVERPYSYQ